MNKENYFNYSLLQSNDVVTLARELIGVELYTKVDGLYCSGMIVETEAYSGSNDKACHAHQQKFTKRTKTMFEKGGTAYIYLCYGIHHLFNIVTNKEGIADAILIRAIHPLEGIEHMKSRRGLSSQKNLVNGPGKLTQALAISKAYNSDDLGNSEFIGLANYKSFDEEHIQVSTRIGIDYAGEDAKLPYRFYLKNDPNVSKL